jgi:disulfide bond formation protein DsbB
VITAWKWIPILTGSNGSTVQTTIGGQTVNVTVYWQPTYIGLSGSGLLLPPQNSISITLHYQQPDYWVMPGGVMSKNAYSGATSTGTIANQPSGVPSLAPTSSGTQSSSLYYLPTQIPAIPQMAVNGSTAGSQGNFLGVDFLIVATAAFIAVALAVVFVAVRYHTKRPPTPIR